MVCLIYIAVHSGVRLLFGKDRGIFFADIVFCVITAVVSFFFMVFYNDGQVRLHLILGEAFGFFVFMRSVGKHLLKGLLSVAQLLHNIAVRLLYPFLRVGRAFLGIFRLAREKIRLIIRKKSADGSPVSEKEKKVKINSKKFYFIGKILLKIQNKSV